jgi:hypothetical protein
MSGETSKYVGIDAERHAVLPLIQLAGFDFKELVGLATVFGTCWQADIIESETPVEELRQRSLDRAAAAIVALRGDERAGELRALLEAHPGTRFLFLAPAFPIDNAIRWLVGEHNGAVLHRAESTQNVVARLAALLATTSYRSGAGRRQDGDRS